MSLGSRLVTTGHVWTRPLYRPVNRDDHPWCPSTEGKEGWTDVPWSGRHDLKEYDRSSKRNYINRLFSDKRTSFLPRSSSKWQVIHLVMSLEPGFSLLTWTEDRHTLCHPFFRPRSRFLPQPKRGPRRPVSCCYHILLPTQPKTVGCSEIPLTQERRNQFLPSRGGGHLEWFTLPSHTWFCKRQWNPRGDSLGHPTDGFWGSKSSSLVTPRPDGPVFLRRFLCFGFG